MIDPKPELGTLQKRAHGGSSDPSSPWTADARLAIALAVGIAYFIGAKFGFALTFAPNPVSILWPPNALILAGLLIAPVRVWPFILAAVLPAHLVVELAAGVPLPMVLCWYVSNCVEALIGASALRWLAPWPLRFDRLASVVAFAVCGAILGPFLSSFLDAAFVAWNDWGSASYFEVWRGRFFSNVLATMTIVPPIITWMAVDIGKLRKASVGRMIEATLLAGSLTAIALLAFVSDLATASPSFPALLFLPVPIMVWAALRFGPAGASTAFALVACMVIWGAGHGGGPFRSGTLYEGELPVQLYLISLAPTLLALAAVLEERQLAQRLLRGSEERFSRAFRNSPDAMSISRASDGRLIDVNERWEDLFGYLREEALGQSLLELLRPTSRDRANIEQYTAAGEAIRDFGFDAHHRRGDRLRLVLATEAVELDGEICQLATIRDVTEQERAEKEAHQQRRQLTHLSRVNLLGELSGALAHELNQPLTAILNNAQAAKRFLARPDPDLDQLREILDEIAASDQRAATVIQRLRALLNKGESGVEQLDLNQILEETLDFAHGDVITHDVTVSTHFETRLPRISGDRVQLQQLYLNLVNNACEAMTDVEPAARVLRVASAPVKDGAVQAIIADSGPGIAANRLEQVFEPFVTTKATGLGLGLAICRTIVDAHGGRIWVENGARGGATFFTEFPALR